MLKHSRNAFVIALAMVCAGSFAPARAEDAPEKEKISLSAIVDWYYQYSFNHPPSGANLPARVFDVKQNSFTLSLVELNVNRAPTEKIPVGITGTFVFGQTADLAHATEPQNIETWKHILQLFATYTIKGKIPVAIDFGKFVTNHGYEVIESSGNDNYSRSFQFYASPFYHMGLRATATLNPTTTAALYIVNGWNNSEDDNGAKTLGASLLWNPSAKYTLGLNYMGGDEFTGAALPRNLNLQFVDFVGVWRPTDKLKFATNVDYASAAKAGVAGGNWVAWSLYGRYQADAKHAIALRLEKVQDSNGLRTGVAQNIGSFTTTLERNVGTNVLFRLEYRHDNAGTAFFPSGGSDYSVSPATGLNKSQDTITFANIVRF